MTALAPSLLVAGMDMEIVRGRAGGGAPRRGSFRHSPGHVLGLDGDVASMLGDALPRVSTLSVESDSGPRATPAPSPSDYTPTRRRTHPRGGGNSRDFSGSEDGYGSRLMGDAGSSRAGSYESTDSGSDRRTRRRRNCGGSGSPGSPQRYRDRSRDSRRRHDSGSSGSLSPRWDRGGAANGRYEGGARGSDHKNDSPPRRHPGEGGSPRELEPSKVLHVRNVGYPVTQSDLVSLLSCFGQVEKVKMFNGQALVQLPSVSIAKATMRHFDEDQEARIGSKRVYINYSRSKSIEGRDVDVTNSGNHFSSNGSNNGSATGVSGNGNALDVTRALSATRVGGVPEANGSLQDAASAFGHLTVEDHAKLLGLATCYLQNYGITGGEGAILNINQREEIADYQRQAVAAALALNGGSGHGQGIATWGGNPAFTAVATNRFVGGMSVGGPFGSSFGSPRPRPGNRGSLDAPERSQNRDRDRGGRGGGQSQR